jgi:predicted TIM-barrel enzyme
VIHLGITTATAVPCDQTISEAAAAVRGHPGTILLIHGGPYGQPADVARLQQRQPRIDGFFGVSSIECIPIQAAVAQAVTAFAYQRNTGPP